MPDHTHDATRTSWVDSNHDLEGYFPLQNLPLGVFSTSDHGARIGTAIADHVLDLKAAGERQLLDPDLAAICSSPRLNDLLAAGPAVWRRLRHRLSELLGSDTCPSEQGRNAVRRCLYPRREARMHLPATIGDYTDFYASAHHATNVGRLFRPDNPLLPNYRWIPIGYHGRSSSIVVDDTPVRRPGGQSRKPDDTSPLFGPTRALDFELEVGALVGPGNSQGTSIPLAKAAGSLFGLVLLNDWSARDIQAWEYQPLGPFLGKSFATTISPWVVSLDALEPFRVPVAPRSADEPAPLPYLTDASDQERGAFDLRLEILLTTEAMRATGEQPWRLSSSNLRSLYWTFGQMVAHHTSNGCNLRPGDLLGSGTVSGPSSDSSGCLLELTRGGSVPLTLPNGEQRRYLEDGDEVTFRGWCEKPGFRRIGLGECRGRILPAG